MVGSRVLHILKEIPVGSIKAGDREVLTSIATQTEKYKRLDVAIESQTALMHETLLDCVDMIDPKTHHCVMTRVLLDYIDATHSSEADPIPRITVKEFDEDGNAMPTAHYPVKKTGEKTDVKSTKDEGKK